MRYHYGGQNMTNDSRPTSTRGRRPEIDPEQISAIAVELFAENGYDAVTVEQVATKAGISRRSLYRYFPDKYDLLLADTRRRQREVVEEFRRRPPGEPTFVSICEAFIKASKLENAEPGVQAALLRRVLTDDERLFERFIADAQQMSEELRALVAERHGLDGDDFRADLLVRLARAGAEAAVRRWVADGCRRDLRKTMRSTLDFVRDAIDGSGIVDRH
jgi:AcrR family transcriptional regulator